MNKNLIAAFFLWFVGGTTAFFAYPIIKWYNRYFEVEKGSMGDFAVIMLIMITCVATIMGGLYCISEKPFKSN